MLHHSHGHTCTQGNIVFLANPTWWERNVTFAESYFGRVCLIGKPDNAHTPVELVVQVGERET